MVMVKTVRMGGVGDGEASIARSPSTRSAAKAAACAVADAAKADAPKEHKFIHSTESGTVASTASRPKRQTENSTSNNNNRSVGRDDGVDDGVSNVGSKGSHGSDNNGSDNGFFPSSTLFPHLPYYPCHLNANIPFFRVSYHLLHFCIDPISSHALFSNLPHFLLFVDLPHLPFYPVTWTPDFKIYLFWPSTLFHDIPRPSIYPIL